MSALGSIGAEKVADIFAEAIHQFQSEQRAPISTVTEYVAAEQESGMLAIDMLRYSEVENEALTQHLHAYEAECVEWVK